jgi:hypothetical protein
MSITITPTVTPIMATVERLDFAVGVLPPGLPELVVPPVVVVGVTVLGA